MSTSSNILVNIIGEFHKKGFNDAEKATKGLSGSFDKLGKKLAAAFSVGAVIKFAKVSLKAFEDDQKAAFRLTQTLKNLGMAFEDPQVTAFISRLEQTTGVLDDELRPAMGRLLQTTGSFIKSQKLLSLAIDVSRGSGYDLQTVVSDLTRAYVGQTRGLQKYNLGLTQTELKTASFVTLQDKLNAQFSGQNAAYLQTYAGQLSLINVAYSNMTESIGEGLVDAFGMLAGEHGIQGATDSMREFGTITADIIRGTGSLLGELTQSFSGSGGLQSMLDLAAKTGNPLAQTLAGLQQRGAAVRPLQFPKLGVGEPALAKERAKLEAEAEARAKRLAALQAKAERDRIKRDKEAAKREREQQALKRAGTVFDMENIQIVAAMQGKINEDQRLRLTALLALNNGNAEAADKLTSALLAAQAPALANLGIMVKAGDNAQTVIDKIIDAQTRLFLLGIGIGTIPKAKNPFEDWKDVMAAILSDIGRITNAINGIPKYNPTGNNVQGGTSTSTAPSGGTQFDFLFREHAQAAEAAAATIAPAPIVDEQTQRAVMGNLENMFSFPDIAGWRAFESGDTIVNVTIGGSVTTETDLVSAITDAILNAEKSGRASNWSSVAL